MTHRPLLPTYPEYKPSGIPWLDEIPAHWEARRLKTVCRLAYGNTLTAEMRVEGPVPVYGSNGQIGVHSSANTNAPCIIVGRKGSFGKVNYSEEPVFAIDTAFFVDDRYANADLRWLYYYLRWLKLDDASRDSAIPGLNRQEAYRRVGPVPPPEEQAAIARYLTHKEALIQRWLNAKRRLLASLKQLRKSTIHYTVIHGLDPDNTPMKPSGIPWLDEIPAHWQTIPLKFWVRINDAVLPENTDPNYEFRYIDIGSIGTGVRVEEPEKMRFETAPSRARRIVRNGDTIFSTVRTYLKAVWFADDPDDDLICSTGFAVFTPRQNTSPKFVSYVAQSDSFVNRVTANSFGVTYPAINTSRLGSLRVPVPPLEEQAAIAEYLDDRIAKIDAATAGTSRLIDLMEQYRKSLIHELVTGARDVRKAAAAIPDDPTPNPPTP